MIQKEDKGKWFSNYWKVVEFATYLVREQLYDAENILGYLAKPWAWDKEYIEWLSSKGCE